MTYMKSGQPFLYDDETGDIVGFRNTDTGAETMILRTSTDDSGNTVLLGGDGAVSQVSLKARKTRHIIKPTNAFSGSATTGGVTQCGIYTCPVKFDAIRIGYTHVGGVGAASNIIACVAASDDFGPLDYALGGSDATLKKMITPRRGGTEYNTVEQNGWHAVTWSGAASTGAADAGAATKHTVVWSDIIPVECIEDVNNPGLYPLLVRLYPGAGPYTSQNYSGASTGTNYVSGQPAKFGQHSRAGDQVTTPGNYSTANTPALSSSAAPPIIIEFLSAEYAPSVAFVGDSRLESVTETAYTTTHAFAGLPYLFQIAAHNAGKKVGVIRSGRSGYTSSQYSKNGIDLLANCKPKACFYLGYSVNDGSATSAVISIAKANTLKFIDACIASDCIPIIISAFPDLSWNATYLANVRDFKSWCVSLGFPVFDAMERYGDSSGITLSAYNDGSLGSHFNQAGYTLMAEDLVDFAAAYL